MAVAVLATAGLQAWYVYEYYSWATYLLIIAGLAVAAYIVLSANKKFNKKASLSAILVTLLLAPDLVINSNAFRRKCSYPYKWT